MTDQEFRDRCARAMGWCIAPSPGWFADDPDLCNVCEVWDMGVPGHLIGRPFWRPDKDYNQAMMMRDECERRGLLVEFARELLGTTAIGADWRFDLDSILQLARMSAPRIAEAALKVLESQASARTQEDK